MSDSISIRTVPGSRDDLAAEFPSNVYGAGALRNIPLQLRREFLRRDDETGPQSLDRPGRYAVVTGIEGGDEVMAAIKVFSRMADALPISRPRWECFASTRTRT